MKIGSLFSGYGGLDMAVMNVTGASVAWHVEFDEAPSKILAKHFPDIPNYGDITKVDFTKVEPVDILTGGFPCQDLSIAGRRAGMEDGTRSGLWAEFRRAIEELQPEKVIIENVRGIFSAKASSGVELPLEILADFGNRPVLTAMQAVLGDLATIGYDSKWCSVRASDVGAAHARFRVFIVASRQH
jgi:DNA (cytosine-5)-methyltransferase 1